MLYGHMMFMNFWDATWPTKAKKQNKVGPFAFAGFCFQHWHFWCLSVFFAIPKCFCFRLFEASRMHVWLNRLDLESCPSFYASKGY